ncbi:RagB/SusD family nutrient uptake outer membrane protein [Anditalea andensis]|uniref:Carbohydrate-binding protein SusD n=1 Tax=Anditalea andensis TaxID=1048983 RepID=A0A074L1E8_9BACT|nr:RagB/SusD family nutrient uptake outer membrane protein [Anditalea andensis]KEO74320.1 carbohydrate-binding protein SusD [Anditalea andensis]
MSNTIYKSISIWMLGLTLIASSCMEDELLFPEPQLNLTENNIYDNPERILGLVNGFYNGLKAGYFYGGRYVMYGDFRGEDFINRTNNIFTGYDTWSHNINSSSNEVQLLWADAYTTINQTNLFLEGLEANKDKVDAVLAEQYLAEAKFVRALSYFSMITLYSRPYQEDDGASPGLPLRLRAEKTTANNDLARSTVAEVYAQILKDLDEAEEGLPLSYATPLLNTTRAHQNTAIALKTRVYLTMGNYEKVIEEASKIVTASSPFVAPSGVAHGLNDIMEIFRTNYTSTESIFSMPMTELSSSTGQNSLGFIYNVSAEYYLNPQGIFADPLWPAHDNRRGLFRVSGGLNYLTKYAKPAPFLDFVPVIRYAEVLLNYAEALAETGNLGASRSLLDEVRHRSDPDFIFPDYAVSTQDTLIETILKERRIELIGEGFRSNDLLRRGMTIPSKGSSSLIAPAVTPGQEEYIFPMPNSEIITNSLL